MRLSPAPLGISDQASAVWLVQATVGTASYAAASDLGSVVELELDSRPSEVRNLLEKHPGNVASSMLLLVPGLQDFVVVLR